MVKLVEDSRSPDGFPRVRWEQDVPTGESVYALEQSITLKIAAVVMVFVFAWAYAAGWDFWSAVLIAFLVGGLCLGRWTFTAFTAHASDTSGWRDLPAREAASGVLIVDDPGPLKTPQGMSSYIQIRGVSKRPDGIIGAVMNEGDILVRHKFFSAVLGKPVHGIDAGAPGPAYVTDFEPRQEGLHMMSGVTLRQALIDGLGGPRAAAARFSRQSARAGRGSFYGLAIGGERYLAVQMTDSAEYRDYDFFWDGPGGLKPVAAATKVAEKHKPADLAPFDRSYHLIAVAEAGSAERLLVFRRGQRSAAVAGLWPLAAWLAKMEALVEADPKALPDAGVDTSLLRRGAGSDAWMAACERFLSAYPSFEVKTGSDEWRRAACVTGATQRRR